MTSLEDLLRDTLNVHTSDAPGPARVISTVIDGARTGPNRWRRPTTIGLVAAAAVVVAGAVGVTQYDGTGEGSEVASSPTVSSGASTVPAPTVDLPQSTEPTPSTPSGPLRVLTPQELTGRLAAALPGPSEPNPANTTAQGKVAVRAERFYLGGKVDVIIDNTGFKESDIVTMCEQSGNDGKGQDCVTTDTGWVLTSATNFDATNADNASRQARVYYYGFNRVNVSVLATNYVTDDASNPTSPAPVLDLDQLTALATGTNWYA